MVGLKSFLHRYLLLTYYLDDYELELTIYSFFVDTKTSLASCDFYGRLRRRDTYRSSERGFYSLGSGSLRCPYARFLWMGVRGTRV